MSECWRPVSRNPNYEVSDLGRVRRANTGRVLKPAQNSSRAGKRPGYFVVSLGYALRCQYVHQLVAEAFLGPRPAGHDTDHRDKDRSNNRASNLRWLPAPANRVQWHGPDRRDWVLAKEADPPQEHIPMTEDEHEQYQRDHAAAGW